MYFIYLTSNAIVNDDGIHYTYILVGVVVVIIIE